MASLFGPPCVYSTRWAKLNGATFHFILFAAIERIYKIKLGAHVDK